MDKKDNMLFSDFFSVKDVDKDGKKFDRVSRIGARSENYDMELTLDVNCELYPLDHGDRFSLVLASSLNLNSASAASGQQSNLDSGFGKADANWRTVVGGTERSLADEYDYVMYGRIYRFDDTTGSKVSVFISFGGLLMCLEGESHHLQNLTVSENVYLLLKR
ncbi:DNA-directed RNA polymerases I, II, and III subunit rpabc3 [Smittium mucronatum]|uniref:DNA-directed RNA polymerases I, II, and III subunit rpabc3 n=1 Tax=Smittium mucronatum TaxID=133383 RepID=A0A1R0GX36_9FUNG|nr:DNA-directed RNA polymerases I, II, and III subunit rpabc3 [Smittium mucronatum]